MDKPTNTAEFKAFATDLQQCPNYVQPELFGLFVAQKNASGEIISGKFLSWNYLENFGSAAVLMDVCGLLDDDRAFRSTEVVIPLRDGLRDLAQEALDTFPADIRRTAKGDLHLNVQALQKMVADKEARDFHYAVFVFENEAAVQTIATTLLKLTCHVEETSTTKYMLYTDGLKDVLLPLMWKGDMAYDPHDVMVDDSTGEFDKRLNMLPPGLRGGIVTG